MFYNSNAGLGESANLASLTNLYLSDIAGSTPVPCKAYMMFMSFKIIKRFVYQALFLPRSVLIRPSIYSETSISLSMQYFLTFFHNSGSILMLVVLRSMIVLW